MMLDIPALIFPHLNLHSGDTLTQNKDIIWSHRSLRTVFSATLAGYFNEGDRKLSYHLYAVRTWVDGELVQVRQTHSRHHWAVQFKRGTNDFIKAVSVFCLIIRRSVDIAGMSRAKNLLISSRLIWKYYSTFVAEIIDTGLTSFDCRICSLREWLRF